MNTTDKTFCTVCDKVMSDALHVSSSPAPASPIAFQVIPASFFQPPVAPPQPERSVRLLIEIHSQSQEVQILRATDIDGPTVVNQRLIGSHAYQIQDGANVITGVLAGSPFESRAFDGRSAGHPAPALNESATVVIMVPRKTIQNLLVRGVTVTLYRLDPSLTRENITTPRLNGLKGNLARPAGVLTAEVMSNYLQQLTRTPRQAR